MGQGRGCSCGLGGAEVGRREAPGWSEPSVPLPLLSLPVHVARLVTLLHHQGPSCQGPLLSVPPSHLCGQLLLPLPPAALSLLRAFECKSPQVCVCALLAPKDFILHVCCALGSLALLRAFEVSYRGSDLPKVTPCAHSGAGI